MELLVYIIIFSSLGSVFSVFLASIVLLLPDRIRMILIPWLVSYAAGTLLGAAFLGMLPKAILLSGNVQWILFMTLIGLLLFFALEKIVLWRHCHKIDCEVHNAAGPIIIIGDAFHNLIDGIVIASAFLISVPSGILVSLAVIAHEVPQELGDFSLLIQNGYNKKTALLLNLLSSSTTIIGAVVSFFAMNKMNSLIPYVLSMSGASFIYIALADILPGLQKQLSLAKSLIQFILIVLGISTIAFIKMHS